jgi:hypothetical protein
MLKLVEAVVVDPIRFPVKPGVKLLPGNVVKIVQYDNNLVVDLCDGYNAIGLLGNRCSGGNKIDFTKSAKVYPQRMIADIKHFDRNNLLSPGCSLYCNFDGVLSSKKPFESALILAKVISPITEKRNAMQILWL